MSLLRTLLARFARFLPESPVTPATTPARLDVEPLESRTLLSGSNTLSAREVQQLLRSAAASTGFNDAIIAVVDREGDILGVRVEGGVSPFITGNLGNLVFAVDGALALARTGAFFANNDAPLTSRTVEFISQTTITAREVNSNPDIGNPFSPFEGPGFVAPVGNGGHFPPGIANTPPVDLFGIELTNRDTIFPRFNVNPAFIPAGNALFPPVSYGVASGLLPTAQSRGIGTLPGGVPIYKDGNLVGGIGVFFPGLTGFASAENSSLSAGFNKRLPDRSVEAEYMALAAEGIQGSGPIPGLGIPPGFLGQQINLAGITLPIFGPPGRDGLSQLLAFGATLGHGNPDSGYDLPINPQGDRYRDGLAVPSGWLVLPHDGVGISAADVARMIDQGIATAMQTRSQIRLPIGTRASQVFAVADTTGDVLGLYRMPDATVFSLGVAVAKARNMSYYDDPVGLSPLDRVRGLPPGVAMTPRDFRELALAQFPEGTGTQPGPFSILNDHGNLPIDFQSALGYVAFNPQANFHDTRDPLSNQNGVVFFPGGSAVYNYINSRRTFVGGLGVSGDGVNQDDFITAGAIVGFEPPGNVRADRFSVRGVRLPYFVFPRNPLA
jgi:uncharacterized protein GlcG (DUF336 family)